MISQELTLEKIPPNHSNAELLKIARIRSWHKVKGKDLYEATVDEIDAEPDDNCIIIYTLPDNEELKLYVLHGQQCYKVVDQRIHNRMTIDLLDALKKCDLTKLKQLAKEVSYCEWHDFDGESADKTCITCGKSYDRIWASK